MLLVDTRITRKASRFEEKVMGDCVEWRKQNWHAPCSTTQSYLSDSNSRFCSQFLRGTTPLVDAIPL